MTEKKSDLVNLAGLFEKYSKNGNVYFEGSIATKNTDEKFVVPVAEAFAKIAENPRDYVLVLFPQDEGDNKPTFNLAVRKKREQKKGLGKGLWGKKGK